MNILPEDKSLRRKLSALAAILGLVLYTACFLFARLEVVLTSDILLIDSFPAKLLSFLQTLAISLGFALFYSFTAFLCFHIKTKRTLPFIFIVVGFTFFRSLLALCGQYLIDGIETYDFLLYALPTQTFSFCLELIQYLLILFIIWYSLRNPPKNAEAPQVIRRTLFFISMTVMILNVGSRVLYDIDYGAPTSSEETLQMVLAYASDVLIYGVLLFFVMHLLTRWANNIRQKL